MPEGQVREFSARPKNKGDLVAVSGIRVAIGQFNELTDEKLHFAGVVWVPEQR
jgi:hypothetical protein